MHKRLTKHLWKIWGSISLSVVIILVILSALGSVYGLRSNNQQMVELRNAVFEADQKGVKEDIDTSLRELADFVTTNMNTDLRRDNAIAIEGEPPVQLVYKYYRDNITELSRVGGTQANLKLIGDARVACEVSTVPITERLACVRQELANSSNDTFPVVEPLSKDFYVYDFASPTWSPDLAGWSLVLFASSIVLLTARFIVGAIVSKIIRSRH